MKKVTIQTIGETKICIDLSACYQIAIIIILSIKYILQFYFRDLSYNSIWKICIVGIVSLLGFMYLKEVLCVAYCNLIRSPMKKTTFFLFGSIPEWEDCKNNFNLEIFLALIRIGFSIIIVTISFAMLTFANRKEFSIETICIIKFIYITNLIWLIVNILPGYPLDCGRMLKSILFMFYKNEKKSHKLVCRIGTDIGLLIILAAMIMVFNGMITAAVFIIIMGLSIRAAASECIQKIEISKELLGIPVEKVMEKIVCKIPASLNVDKFVNTCLYKCSLDMYSVFNKQDKCINYITAQKVMELPINKWNSVLTGELACQNDDVIKIDKSCEVIAAYYLMYITETKKMIVIDLQKEGQIVGYVTIEIIMTTIIRILTSGKYLH